MSFGSVIRTQINGRTTNAYVLATIGTLSPTDVTGITQFLNLVESKNRDLLNHGYKHVVLLWSDNNITMADWWVWGEKESENEGSLIEVFLFRGVERYESPSVTAEDGLKILASEIELG